MIYAVGDIHGRFDEWIQMKNRIESEDPDATFILVGDIEDRGPKPCEMIRWAMENITIDRKYQMIKGNHEDGKVSWWRRVKNYAEYDKVNLNNFCYTSYIIEQYGFDQYMWDSGVSSAEMEKIIVWMDNLPYYKDIDVNGQRFIIVHANMYHTFFVNGKIKENLRNVEKEFILWDRNSDGFYDVDAILINGHTPTIFDEAFPYNVDKKYGKILETHNRFNIDCGAGYIGVRKEANLAILCLDNLKEYYLREI